MNYVLGNDDIKKRMTEIGEGIRNDRDGLEEICDLIYKECGKQSGLQICVGHCGLISDFQ